MDGEPTPASGPPEDLGAFAAARLARHVDLWGTAAGKLTAGRYQAADLVDDWCRWVGLVAQDTTAAVTLLLGTAAPPDGERPRGAPGRG